MSGHQVPECGRPRGAPELGTEVSVEVLDGTYYRATVVAYLSAQFIVERADGTTRVVGVQEWRPAK